MLQNRTIAPLPVFFLFLLSGCQQSVPDIQSEAGLAEWMYLGQTLPGATPVLFSPGLISTRANERDLALSPDGRTLFFSYALPGYIRSAILMMHHNGNTWSGPQVAGFSGTYSDLEPAFSPDGSRLFFISKRPVRDHDTISDWNIWYTDHLQAGWAEPKEAGASVNSEGNEFYPSIAENGNLYLTIECHPGSFGGEDIYYCPFVNDAYGEPVNLGPAVNSAFPEFNAYVSPDEQFLIFSSIGREGEYGGGDLYISTRDEKGIWQQAISLGPRINSEHLDYCPFVTPDGDYLFFTSQRTDSALAGLVRKELQEFQQIEANHGNGLGDIYWVEFDLAAWK